LEPKYLSIIEDFMKGMEELEEEPKRVITINLYEEEPTN
jgi:hypothetical protein